MNYDIHVKPRAFKDLAALQEAGVETKLIVKKGGGHPWPTIHEEVKLATDWLDEHLSAK